MNCYTRLSNTHEGVVIESSLAAFLLNLLCQVWKDSDKELGPATPLNDACYLASMALFGRRLTLLFLIYPHLVSVTAAASLAERITDAFVGSAIISEQADADDVTTNKDLVLGSPPVNCSPLPWFTQ